jgi:hypothetical protein
MTKQKRNYNAENKSRIRNIIVDLIRNRDIKSILTLESPEFLFSKLLPDKELFVWENNATEFNKMEKKIPKNVELTFGNIGKFGMFKSKVDCIYLDFCSTFEKEQGEIIRLKDCLKQSKLFICTFCMRSNEKLVNRYYGDYQFDLINKLQTLTDMNWKVLYGESYTDSVQMVTIILENKQ